MWSPRSLAASPRVFPSATLVTQFHRLGRSRWLFLLLLVLLVMNLVSPPPVRAPRLGPEAVGLLPPPAQAAISAAIGRDQASYHVATTQHGYRLSTANQRLSATFTLEGVTLHQGETAWPLGVIGVIYKGVAPPMDPVMPWTEANRVEYRRPGLTEWYVNGPQGIQQGVTFNERPTLNYNAPNPIVSPISPPYK